MASSGVMRLALAAVSKKASKDSIKRLPEEIKRVAKGKKK
jgi:hypothetical protein